MQSGSENKNGKTINDGLLLQKRPDIFKSERTKEKILDFMGNVYVQPCLGHSHAAITQNTKMELI